MARSRRRLSWLWRGLSSTPHGFPAGSTADTLGVLLYPTLDVLALAAGVRMFGAAWRSRPLLLVAAGLLAMLAADCGYAVSAMSYTIGGALDNGWLVAYLCFAVAACSPGTTVTRGAREELRFRPFRLEIVGLALVATNVAATLSAHAVDTEVEMIVTGFCSVALAGLVIARMAVVLRAHDRARLRARRASTDALAAQRDAETARGDWRPNTSACSSPRVGSGRSSSTRASRSC
jgi:hypothetical protein